MNDIIVFLMGCFVSLMVAGAVGLLMWGAANEPRGRLVPRNDGGETAARDRKKTAATVSPKSA